jgi:hypothetical protein
MTTFEPPALEDPQLQIGSLKVWIHGRQFPNAKDYWDGNWLRITAECSSSSSKVKIHGPIIHLGELAGLLVSCRQLYENLSGEANLDCMEPELNVRMKAGSSGQIRLEISITPDNLNEEHLFRQDIDQSYLPSIIAACESILAEHLVRNPDDRAHSDA